MAAISASKLSINSVIVRTGAGFACILFFAAVVFFMSLSLSLANLVFATVKSVSTPLVAMPALPLVSPAGAMPGIISGFCAPFVAQKHPEMLPAKRLIKSVFGALVADASQCPTASQLRFLDYSVNAELVECLAKRLVLPFQPNDSFSKASPGALVGFDLSLRDIFFLLHFSSHKLHHFV